MERPSPPAILSFVWSRLAAHRGRPSTTRTRRTRSSCRCRPCRAAAIWTPRRIWAEASGETLGDEDARRGDHIDDPARAADPRTLKRFAAIHAAYRRVAQRGRVVRDDVSRRREADDHEQVSVRSIVVEEAWQRAPRVRDRRDERDPGEDVALGVVQRAELQHSRGEAEA